MNTNAPLRLAAAVLCAAAASAAHAQASGSACGDLANGFGPYDYRTDRQHLGIVERPHFPPIVEALVAGNRGTLGGDLDYTLRAFPNHHRALVAVMRYGEKMKSPQPRDLRYPVECYFERAVRFRPDDAVARMLFAQYLAKQDRKDDARRQLGIAAEGAKDNAFTHYNLGLGYLEIKAYDQALQHAHRAYALGFDRPALREALAAAGQWRDAPADTPAAATEAPAASAAAPAATAASAAGPTKD